MPLPPPSASSTARTTKEVLDKLVDADSVPIDLLSQFEVAVLPVAPGGNDAKLHQMTDRHRETCETLQATEDALHSARRDVAHQKKIHEDAARRLQARIDDLQVQVTRLVKTLDRKRSAHADLGAVDTCIQPATNALLSLARKLPPQGTQVPDVLQAALDQIALRTTPVLTTTMRHGTRHCRFYSRPGCREVPCLFKICKFSLRNLSGPWKCLCRRQPRSPSPFRSQP